MTLEEAIKEQETTMGEGWFAHNPELEKAIKLGIEALKEIKRVRASRQKVRINLLSGETDE